MPHLSDDDFARLLAFRTGLRRFHSWSERQARESGLTAAQHQLLLAVRGHSDPRGPTIGDAADYLMLKHHSTVELVNRAAAGGWVQRRRDADDGRVVRLLVTEKGNRALDQLTALHIEELRRLAPLLEPLTRGLDDGQA